jgi:hypothetical protein
MSSMLNVFNAGQQLNVFALLNMTPASASDCSAVLYPEYG